MEERLLFYRIRGDRRDVTVHQGIQFSLDIHPGLARANLTLGYGAPSFTDTTSKCIWTVSLIEE
jgi:hypothetical protein